MPADSHILFKYETAHVAQALLSVLVRLARTENYARDNR